MFVVDFAFPARSAALIGGAVAGFCALEILRAGAAVFGQFRLAQVGNAVQAGAREAVFQRALLLPLSSFERSQSGYVNARLAEVGSISLLFSPAFISGVVSALEGLFAFVLMTIISPCSALAVLVSTPVLAGLAVWQGRAVRSSTTRALEEAALASSVIQETVAGIQTVKEFGTEHRETERAKHRLESLRDANVAQARVVSIGREAITLGGVASTALVMATAGMEVLGGRLSLGQYMTVIGCVARIVTPIGMIAALYSVVAHVASALERTAALVDEVGESPIVTSRTMRRPDGSAVEFRDVCFTYPSRPTSEVLKGVTFRISHGQRVALTGPSGSGKSTIAKLMVGLYRPSRGTVELCGLEPWRASPKGRVAVVSQQTCLFDDTVANNIRYARPDATDVEVRQASIAAGADSFVTLLANGYETRVGERGYRLSGGQAQRIAIARAILAEPEVIVLDEPTSQLDAEAACLVWKALAELCTSRTVLIISHSWDQIGALDCVFELSGGVVSVIAPRCRNSHVQRA